MSSTSFATSCYDASSEKVTRTDKNECYNNFLKQKKFPSEKSIKEVDYSLDQHDKSDGLIKNERKSMFIKTKKESEVKERHEMPVILNVRRREVLD